MNPIYKGSFHGIPNCFFTDEKVKKSGRVFAKFRWDRLFAAIQEKEFLYYFTYQACILLI